MKQVTTPIRNLSRHYVWLAVFFCVLGGALRFFNLGGQRLWADELHTWEIASGSLSTIWQTTRIELHPPLYNALQGAILKILPPTEANLRLLPAVSGLVVIPVLGLYLARNHGRTAAIVGMLFVATSPVQVYYSQEARVYALSGLYVVISLLAVRWVEQQPSLRAWLTYSAVAIVGICLNYFLAAVLLAQIIWLGLQSRIRRQKLFFVSLLLMTIFCLPLVPNAIASQRSIPNFNLTDAWNMELPSTFESMLIGDNRYIPRPARWIALGIFALFSLAGVAQLGKRSSLYLFMIGLPTTVVFVLLRIMGLQSPHYSERQFIVLAPAAWVLVAAGVSFLWQGRSKFARVMTIALCATWVIAASFGLGQYFGEFEKSGEQAVVNWLTTERTEQQPILLVGPPAIGGAFKYYAPETHFLFLYRYLEGIGADEFWISEQELQMFPLSPPSERCALANLHSSQEFWLVEYIWLDEDISFVNSLEQIRATNLAAQAGNYQIYYVSAIPGGDELRCEEIPQVEFQGSSGDQG